MGTLSWKEFMKKDYSDSIPDYLRYSTWKSDAKFSERIKAVAVIQGNSIEVHVAPTKEPQPATRSNLKARHGKNTKKGKMSAAYWSDREKG
tara:strand:+ start:242 stop:514 length:273 start_codon:yes stop_codon:yes gene_type:complete